MFRAFRVPVCGPRDPLLLETRGTIAVVNDIHAFGIVRPLCIPSNHYFSDEVSLILIPFPPLNR